jgi:hypothetical protein
MVLDDRSENLIPRCGDSGQRVPAARPQEASGHPAMDILGIVLATPCLAWNGQFFWTHLDELRFWGPAVLLHAWLIGVVASAVFRLVRRGEASGSGSRLPFQVLLVSGMVVWPLPVAIVAARAWLGVNLYELAGSWPLLLLLAGSMAAALVTLGIFAFGARRSSALTRQAV